jgi:hypothetical protein
MSQTPAKANKAEPNNNDGSLTPNEALNNFQFLQITMEPNFSTNISATQTTTDNRTLESEKLVHFAQKQTTTTINITGQTIKNPHVPQQTIHTQTIPNTEIIDEDTMNCEDDENFEYNDELNFLIDRFDLKEKKPNFMPYIY